MTMSVELKRKVRFNLRIAKAEPGVAHGFWFAWGKPPGENKAQPWLWVQKKALEKTGKKSAKQLQDSVFLSALEKLNTPPPPSDATIAAGTATWAEDTLQLTLFRNPTAVADLKRAVKALKKDPVLKAAFKNVKASKVDKRKAKKAGGDEQDLIDEIEQSDRARRNKGVDLTAMGREVDRLVKDAAHLKRRLDEAKQETESARWLTLGPEAERTWRAVSDLADELEVHPDSGDDQADGWAESLQNAADGLWTHVEAWRKARPTKTGTTATPTSAADVRDRIKRLTEALQTSTGKAPDLWRMAKEWKTTGATPDVGTAREVDSVHRALQLQHADAARVHGLAKPFLKGHGDLKPLLKTLATLDKAAATWIKRFPGVPTFPGGPVQRVTSPPPMRIGSAELKRIATLPGTTGKAGKSPGLVTAYKAFVAYEKATKKKEPASQRHLLLAGLLEDLTDAAKEPANQGPGARYDALQRVITEVKSKLVEVRAQALTDSGKLVSTGDKGGTSGSYFLSDGTEERAFVFKPSQQEALTGERATGENARGEVLAGKLAGKLGQLLGIELDVPPTEIVTLQTDQLTKHEQTGIDTFGPGSKDSVQVGALQEGVKGVEGSVQEWMYKVHPFDDTLFYKVTGDDRADGETELRLAIEHDPSIALLDPVKQTHLVTSSVKFRKVYKPPTGTPKTKVSKQVQKFAVLDVLTMQGDRNPDNMLITQRDGELSLVPIDQGNCFPSIESSLHGTSSAWRKSPFEGWEAMEGAELPFDPALLGSLRTLDVDQIVDELKTASKDVTERSGGTVPELDETALHLQWLQGMALKEAAKASDTLSPKQLAQVIVSPNDKRRSPYHQALRALLALEQQRRDEAPPRGITREDAQAVLTDPFLVQLPAFLRALDQPVLIEVIDTYEPLIKLIDDQGVRGPLLQAHGQLATRYETGDVDGAVQEAKRIKLATDQALADATADRIKDLKRRVKAVKGSAAKDFAQRALDVAIRMADPSRPAPFARACEAADGVLTAYERLATLNETIDELQAGPMRDALRRMVEGVDLDELAKDVATLLSTASEISNRVTNVRQLLQRRAAASGATVPSLKGAIEKAIDDFARDLTSETMSQLGKLSDRVRDVLSLDQDYKKIRDGVLAFDVEALDTEKRAVFTKNRDVVDTLREFLEAFDGTQSPSDASNGTQAKRMALKRLGVYA